MEVEVRERLIVYIVYIVHIVHTVYIAIWYISMNSDIRVKKWQCLDWLSAEVL